MWLYILLLCGAAASFHLQEFDPNKHPDTRAEKGHLFQNPANLMLDLMLQGVSKEKAEGITARIQSIYVDIFLTAKAVRDDLRRFYNELSDAINQNDDQSAIRYQTRSIARTLQSLNQQYPLIADRFWEYFFEMYPEGLKQYIEFWEFYRNLSEQHPQAIAELSYINQYSYNSAIAVLTRWAHKWNLNLNVDEEVKRVEVTINQFLHNVSEEFVHLDHQFVVMMNSYIHPLITLRRQGEIFSELAYSSTPGFHKLCVSVARTILTKIDWDRRVDDVRKELVENGSEDWMDQFFPWANQPTNEPQGSSEQLADDLTTPAF